MAERQQDDTIYITKAQNGDLEAFNGLVLQYQNLVYNVTYRIMGDADAAADATQDCFISAFRRLDSFKGGNFKAWLLRIATNTCYDELRRRKRRPADYIEELPGSDYDDGPPLPATTPSPEEIAGRHELQDAIQNCITALPDDRRMVLVLRDVQGYSYDEIATILEINSGTVKSRLSRARRAIRHCLQAFQELLPPEYRLQSEQADENSE